MVIDYRKFDLFDKLIFEKVTMKPPFRPPSEMSNEACFIYVLEGAQHTYSPTEHLRIQAKDAILLKCGTYFTEFVEGVDYEQCVAIGVHLYPGVLRKIYENEIPELLVTPDQNPVNSYKIAGNALVDAYMQSMLFYFQNPALVDEELLVLKLKELILLLLKTEKAGSIRQVVSGLFSPKTHQLTEVVQAHLYDNLNIDQLAALASMSLSGFKREFERTYGEPPARYIRNKKLEKAEKLLQLPDMRIGDIALECGFADVAHFSKCFQDKYGLPPSQYRLNQINKSLS